MEQCRITANGVKVYAYPSRHLHSFCIGLYIRAGVLYEAPGENGISHFWEHMEYRNLNKLLDGSLYEILDKAGIYLSGCTYKEFVKFSIQGATAHYHESVALLTKILAPFCIGKAEVDLERKRIKREIREADELKSLDYFTDQMVWVETPLAHTILGSLSSVNGILLKQLAEQKKRVLTRDNLFFYLTGCVSEEDIDFCCAEIEKFSLPITTEMRDNTVARPKDFGCRNGKIAVKNSGDTLVRFSFDMELGKRHIEAVNLLYHILFSGENARFYHRMSEELGYIYDFDAVVDRYSNLGNLYFSYEIRPDQLYASIRETMEIINSVKHRIDRRDMALALPAYLDNGDMQLDDPQSLNWNMAYQHIFGVTHGSVEEQKESYRRVTPEELLEVANLIFQDQNMIVTIKGKKDRIHVERIQDILKGTLS